MQTLTAAKLIHSLLFAQPPSGDQVQEPQNAEGEAPPPVQVSQSTPQNDADQSGDVVIPIGSQEELARVVGGEGASSQDKACRPCPTNKNFKLEPDGFKFAIGGKKQVNGNKEETCCGYEGVAARAALLALAILLPAGALFGLGIGLSNEASNKGGK